jgi:hypothetical protein
VFDEYEIIKKTDLVSTILTTHLSSHFLTPNGYVAYCGTKESFLTANMGEFLTSISKKAEM